REIWRQMESFAGYSFNKAHSASFAVESYQSLFLKTYYPLEFMVAVLNNYGGFYNRKVYVNEARIAGGNICLPCVNQSVFNTSIQAKDIYLGFDCILNLEGKLANRIIEQREYAGQYRSLEDFVKRTQAGLEQVILLIRVGALRFIGIGKKQLLWEAHLLMSKHKPVVTSMALFETESRKPILPPLEEDILEDYYDEMELIGFCVTGTLFDLTKSDYRGDIPSKELGQHEGKIVRVVGDFVCEKFVKTKRGDLMKFGTFLDADGYFFDTVHFPQSLAKYPLRGAGIYLVEGKVVVEYGCPSIEVIRCAKMPLKPDPRSE
ncbi:MAG: DNA polymerase III subunit alpha, partial [Sphingobacterium siyangense]